ncbi:Protein TOXD [Talaromyces islandicus]|uniref:Protein TOXD n=1 Tax=Talaromyces islandicus TaxID=28573 RepID=A0A0U1M0T6_TALIS|nr:Protein TOXD [Talaromyces islandicus]
MPSVVYSLPSHQTAVVARQRGQLAVIHDAPVAPVDPKMAIVKTAAVAINPADAKMLDYSIAPGAIHGYDFSGTIVALGEHTPAHLAVGDRVAGVVHGMNALQPNVGGFAEYVGAAAEFLFKIPDDMSFEDAATLGTGVGTAGLALFKELNVPGSLELPEQDGKKIKKIKSPPFILICGGSTATGTRAIELAKIAGLRPIATCSPKNFDLARSFGAEQVFDYHDEDCAEQIRSYTSKSLAYVLDCVSLAHTTQLCLAAIGRAGGRYLALEPYRDKLATRKTVKMSWIMMLTIFGRRVALDGVYGRDAQPEDYELGKTLFAQVQKLLDKGMIHTHPIQLMGGGWDSVVKGVDQIRNSEVSGYKLVYSV